MSHSPPTLGLMHRHMVVFLNKGHRNLTLPLHLRCYPVVLVCHLQGWREPPTWNLPSQLALLSSESSEAPPACSDKSPTRPSTVCLFSSPTPDSLEARSGLVLWRPCRSAPGTYLPEGLCREQGGEFNISKGLSNGNIHPHNTSTQMFVATS